jgi:hypothetical protein
VNLPIGGLGRDDVEVPMDHEGGPGRVLSGDSGDHRAAPRHGLQQVDLQPHLGEQLRDHLGSPAFTRTRVVTEVRGVDP